MDQLTALRSPVAKELEQYSRLFGDTLTHADDYLGQVLTYIRSRRGKMMRPLLVLLIAREFGPVTLTALRSAVTLELLHTASLIHDDVVDDSEERRGQTSPNAVYGNKVAILVGDYLLSKSLEQAALTGNISIVQLIARLGGTLSEGEVRQIDNIRADVATEEAYFDVIQHKTAALFEVCAQLGALAQGATDERVEAARKFGEIVGICFQIRDDIFDYYDDAAIGKPTGNDMAEGKLTLPVLYALRTHGTEEMHRIARRVRSQEATHEEILRLVEFTKQVGGIDYARRKMEELRKEAHDVLRQFRSETIRATLTAYFDYVVGRDF